MGHVMQRTPVLQASSWTHRNRDIGVSGFERSVDAMTNSTIVQQFFDSYTRALLGRDAKAIAEHYAVPALIEFPEHPIAVSEASQTEQFFSGAFGQYEAVSTTHATIKVVAETGHSIWADVTWTHDAGVPSEHFIYQLVRDSESWKIAVLTPLDT